MAALGSARSILANPVRILQLITNLGKGGAETQLAYLASGLARHATGTTIDINGASYVR